MKTRKSRRALSCILALIMIFISLPTYVFAYNEDTEVSAIEESEPSSIFDNEVCVLEEDVSLREENAKHFKLSDGTMKAVSYAQAVHYKDENGNWIDIDNTLSLSGSEYTANNKTEIKFANKSGSNGLLSIKDGEYKIDFTPLNTNKVNVEIENPQENNSRKFDDVKKLNNVVSKATYKSIYDGIDLEYILVGNNIKENIIVNEKQDVYSFSFEIKLNKLKAELSGNEIILSDYDSDEVVYVIPAPYMLDASGEYSDSVEYSLTQNSKWKYTFTVTADPEWINDEARQLPVTIDPTITVGTITKELFVMDEVYDNLSSLIIGNFMGYYDATGFIKFDTLPSIPATSLLVEANLSLYISYVENETGEEFEVGVFEASGDWYNIDIENGKYNVNPTNVSSYHVQTAADEVVMTTRSVYSWNITRLYKDWISGAVANHGVCIKGIDLPSANDTHVSNKRANIRVETVRNDENYMIPNIELTYTHLVGVEDYYAYAENDLGGVGKSYVNLYDGSLTYINNLTSIAVGENLTYDINMVYNSIDKTWTPSFAESIEPHTAIGVEQYIWTDEDGTKHLFTPYLERNSWSAYVTYEYSAEGQLWEVNNPTVFYPEDDIDYVLVQTTNNEFILRDYDGNQKMFDSQGRLSKICDAQGNMVFVNNYSDGNNIASIYRKNSSGDVVFLVELFCLNSGRISHINDKQNEKEIYFSWANDVIDYILYYNYSETTYYKGIDFGYNNKTNLEFVLDSSINQKIMYYIDTKDDEDASNDEKVIEIINVNSTPDQTIKKYVVDYGFCKDLGLDFTPDTNDDLLTTFTFDGKGRNASLTYDDSLFPDSSYYNIVYSQNIYNQGFNLVKYNMISKETDFLNLDIQDINNTSSINTNNVTVKHEIVSNTQVSPYNMVCQILEYYDGLEEPLLSTGFLCGDNTIIMSGHSLREDLSNNNVRDFNFPRKIEVVPGRCLDEDNTPVAPFGVYEVTSFYISKDYYYILDKTDPSATEFDWAVCILDRNVDEDLGYFDIMVSPDEVSEQYIELLGYYNKKMRSSTGWITNVSERRIFYNAPTNDGISGSPIFFNDGNYIVFGIHTTGSDGATGRGGTRINSMIYNLVEFLNN